MLAHGVLLSSLLRLFRMPASLSGRVAAIELHPDKVSHMKEKYKSIDCIHVIEGKTGSGLAYKEAVRFLGGDPDLIMADLCCGHQRPIYLARQ